MNPSVKPLVAEFFGTFALVFAGTGAIIVNDVSGGDLTHVGVALTFGLTVMAVIYAIGDVSGAHINPAVTVGFWLSRRMPSRDVLPYIASQCAGGVFASGILHILFPEHATLGATVPSGTPMQSFFLEIVLAWFLVFVILSVTTGSGNKRVTAGAAIGAVVALEAMFAGPISGASMNPARSLAPALMSGQLDHLWIYIAAPLAGAFLSVPACRSVHEEGCCSAQGVPPSNC